ncbi:DUF7701 domain-containing protein [Haloechinothrix aidingensis]|uniref:DUF7701 domain-containing protein n=1 Tax=Haloechinothrix aidingensis TaxID=2752311 RepID=UPI003CCD65DA
MTHTESPMACQVLMSYDGTLIISLESFQRGNNLNYIDELAKVIRGKLPTRTLPSDDTYDLFRIYAVLLLAKGESVTPEDVHNAWVAWMASRDPNHPSLKPFSDLPSDIAASDEPYADTIRLIAGER